MWRLEAAVGLQGFGYLTRKRDLVTHIAGQLNTPLGELTDKIAALLDRLRPPPGRTPASRPKPPQPEPPNWMLRQSMLTVRPSSRRLGTGTTPPT
ncbi:hypothetical protein [Streptomyces sp. 2314.4]|uniref:hypothetical protein n=1 Tax=unclassified Streptomyces TaxID=2593676 RepID=UPI0026D5F1A3